MPTRFLLETSPPDGYLLEDGSGVLLCEILDGAGTLVQLVSGILSVASTTFTFTFPSPTTKGNRLVFIVGTRTALTSGIAGTNDTSGQEDQQTQTNTQVSLRGKNSIVGGDTVFTVTLSLSDLALGWAFEFAGSDASNAEATWTAQGTTANPATGNMVTISRDCLFVSAAVFKAGTLTVTSQVAGWQTLPKINTTGNEIAMQAGYLLGGAPGIWTNTWTMSAAPTDWVTIEAAFPCRIVQVNPMPQLIVQ